MTFDAEQFKANLTARLRRQYGKDISQANKHDLFDAVSASALEIIMPNWRRRIKQLRLLRYGRNRFANLVGECAGEYLS